MHDTFFTFRGCFAAEEYQITRLQVGEIGCNVYMLAHISLLGSITWNNDVVHEKYGAHETAAIHTFRWSSRPKIRYSHHCVRRTNNIGRILLQAGPPFLLRHGYGFGDVTLTAVGIGHFVEGSFAPFPFQTVACRNVRNRLWGLARFGIYKTVMSRHYNLFRAVPCSHFFFCHGMYTYAVHPGDIIVGSLNTYPAVALQHTHGHSHQALRHHFRWEIRGYAQVCHRDIDNAVRFAFQILPVGKHFETIHYGISFFCQFFQ